MQATLARHVPIGPAALMKMAFDGIDLLPLRLRLMDGWVFDPGNTDALMDLAIVEQIFGNLATGLDIQAEALSRNRLYRAPCSAASPGLRLLAFAAPGDIGANIPLDFLIEGSDVELHTLYLVPGLPLPAVPEHDVAIVTIGESDANRAALAALAVLRAEWPCPILNQPERVGTLARESLWTLLDGIPGLVVPETRRLERRALELWEPRREEAAVVRPVGSHAGRGLAKLADARETMAYLATRDEDEFYLSPYVDYRSADGLFRKYRIAFVDGRPFACHMGILDDWRIWYVNAGMDRSEAKRVEERSFMTGFASGFGKRHAKALERMAETVGLDYFGIDCAETPDGRLLVFEADIAQVVHDMDPPDLFPYKGPVMRELFAAFRAMLGRYGGVAPAV